MHWLPPGNKGNVPLSTVLWVLAAKCQRADEAVGGRIRADADPYITVVPSYKSA